MKVHLDLSLLRLILHLIPVVNFGSFSKTFYLISAKSSFFFNKGAHKTIILIAIDTHLFSTHRNDNILNEIVIIYTSYIKLVDGSQTTSNLELS